MIDQITGDEPALSGAIDPRSFEVWVQFPMGTLERGKDPIRQMCLGGISAHYSTASS